MHRIFAEILSTTYRCHRTLLSVMIYTQLQSFGQKSRVVLSALKLQMLRCIAFLSLAAYASVRGVLQHASA